jgi:hypothetical protein
VKRLQHVADTMCQMYCGWRLIESKPNLVNLGSGTLEIDAITGQSLFQGTRVLTSQKLQKKYAHGCDRIWRQTKSHLQCSLAHVSRSNFLLFVVPWNEPTREIFYSGGKAVRTEKMNRSVMECDSNVTTNEAAYHSKLIEAQEWPLGWPVNTS